MVVVVVVVGGSSSSSNNSSRSSSRGSSSSSSTSSRGSSSSSSPVEAILTLVQQVGVWSPASTLAGRSRRRCGERALLLRYSWR